MAEPSLPTTKAEEDGMDPSFVSAYQPTGARTEEPRPGEAGDGSASDPEQEAEHPPPPAEPGGGAPNPPTRPPSDS